MLLLKSEIISTEFISCFAGRLVTEYPGFAPKSLGWLEPGNFFFTFLVCPSELSRSENLSCVSDWIFVTRDDSFSNLNLNS